MMKYHRSKCYEECYEKKVFEAILSGKQEAPNPVDTHAKGYVKAVLKGKKLVVSGYFKCLESDYLVLPGSDGSTIRLGIAGRNGDVVFVLTPKLSLDNRSGKFCKYENTFILTDEQVELLKERMYYVNINSVDHPTGELRGQLLPKSHKYFLVNLSGDNEVPPVVTGATGTVVAELECYKLTVSGSFQNLETPIAFNILGGAHIHKGSEGENGPVEFILGVVPEENDTAGVFPATAMNMNNLDYCQEKLLKCEQYYINVHSEQFPGGVLRGQLLKM